MMKTVTYRIVEFFVLFIVLPVSLLLPYNFEIKVGSVVLAFVYLVIALFKTESISFKIARDIDWRSFIMNTVLKFVIIAIVTTLYVYILQPASLFCVPRNNLGLWVIILLVYTLLSVWPQEIIYRTFFFKRYGTLFRSRNLLIFVNAVIFSLAHLFFRNALVIVLTFLGGLLFAYTYYKSNSTTLVSIEHALYGNWLFTVGMGEMLAFPGMETCS